MVSVDESKIVKHISLEELDSEIYELERISKRINRLNLIRMVYKTNDIKKSCELLDIPMRTGYGWVKKWNDKGLKGLDHKKGAGRPSFLSKDQLKMLNEWMIGKSYLTTEDVYLYIKEKFAVDYSLNRLEKLSIK
jgi:transposase